MNELEFLEQKRLNFQKYGSVYRPEGGIVERRDEKLLTRFRAVANMINQSSTVR